MPALSTGCTPITGWRPPSPEWGEAGGHRGQDGASWRRRLLAAADDLEDVCSPPPRRTR